MLVRGSTFDVGPSPDATTHLRVDADCRLIRSLLYLVDRASIGGIATAGIVEELGGVLSRITDERDKRVRAVAFEVHHLLHRALLDGDADEVASILGTLESRVGGFLTSGMEVRGYGHTSVDPVQESAEDAIFERVIRPEYEITSPTPADLQIPSGPDFTRTRENLVAALEILHHHDRPSFEEVGSLVTELTVLRSETIKAGTSIRSYGRIWIAQSADDDDVVTCVEAVVHEVAHLYLYLLLIHDPLLTNGADSGFGSPFRPDPRPLSGIYHAMFVLARTIRCLRTLSVSADLLSKLPATAAAKLTDVHELEENFNSVESVLRQHANLTPRGEKLMHACRGLVYKNKR